MPAVSGVGPDVAIHAFALCSKPNRHGRADAPSPASFAASCDTATECPANSAHCGSGDGEPQERLEGAGVPTKHIQAVLGQPKSDLPEIVGRIGLPARRSADAPEQQGRFFRQQSGESRVAWSRSSASKPSSKPQTPSSESGNCQCRRSAISAGNRIMRADRKRNTRADR